jgi:hypothetical protein
VTDTLLCPNCLARLTLIQMRMDEALEQAAVQAAANARLREELERERAMTVVLRGKYPDSEPPIVITPRVLELGPFDQVVLESERPLNIQQLERLKEEFKAFTGTRRPIVLDRGIRVACVLRFTDGVDGEGI